MSYFTFRQNNSGGYWKDPAKWVIIEADDKAEALTIAEGVGLYFDGVGDCECCGNRWNDYDVDCYPEPMIYGSPIHAFKLDDDLDDYYADEDVFLVRRNNEFGIYTEYTKIRKR